MNTGERIKERRKALGMSAETLAEKIGKTASTVYRYEKGDIDKVDSRVIPLIADALSVEPRYLMCWDEAPASIIPADPQEVGLVAIYRGLNATGQDALMRQARYLDSDPDMKKGSTSNTETA